MEPNELCKKCQNMVIYKENYCKKCYDIFLNMERHKFCNNCNEIKNNSNFYKNASYCKACSNQKVSKYFKKKQDIIVNCDCGKEIKFFCMNSHKKTLIHQKRLKIKEYVENQLMEENEKNI